MASDPSQISDPAVRALSRQLVDMQRRLDRIERGSRATQLGRSSIDDGYLLFTDGNGTVRGRAGRQVDGKFGWGAVNGDPPPRPNTPELVGTTAGFNIKWNGEFAGIKPSDFTYTVAYASPAGDMFVTDDSLIVGRLFGAGVIPVTALNGQPIDPELSYWVRLVSYNSSGVASEPSFTAGPVDAEPVVATEILDGIVDTLALADDAVTRAKVAVAAIGTTEIDDDAITSPKVVAEAIQSLHIAAENIFGSHIAAGTITGDKIEALAIVAGHIAANAIEAGHIAAGAITADKLEAILVLASTIIAGDQSTWHLQLGDSETPILYWDGAENTGFAVSRDPATGQANVFLSGRVEFGNGSQLESDYIDLAEQPASGYQVPAPRQSRTWVQSVPNTTVTMKWVSATQTGNLLLASIAVLAASGTTAPTITAPAGWTQIDTQTNGALRLSLYRRENSASRTSETFTTNINCAFTNGLYEFRNMATASFDVVASNSGTGTSAATGTTATTTQTHEMQMAIWASKTAAASPYPQQFTGSTNGFAQMQAASSYTGLNFVTCTRNTTTTGAASSTATLPTSQPWAALVATFKAMPAAGVPPTPAAGALRMFSRARSGYATPHVIDNTGDVYPLGRVPSCRVTLNANFGQTANTDVWAQGDWVATYDPYLLVSISTGVGTYSNITIPEDGVYAVNFRLLYSNTTNTTDTLTCYVARNTRAAGSSIARDARRCINLGSDGSPVHAFRVLELTQNDVLYWGSWSSVNASVQAILVNVRSEISVTYLGPKG